MLDHLNYCMAISTHVQSYEYASFVYVYLIFLLTSLSLSLCLSVSLTRPSLCLSGPLSCLFLRHVPLLGSAALLLRRAYGFDAFVLNVLNVVRALHDQFPCQWVTSTAPSAREAPPMGSRGRVSWAASWRRGERRVPADLVVWCCSVSLAAECKR
jgi:hypothetical protein